MFLSLEARQTVEYLLELVQFSPSNILSMNWYDRVVAYRRGKVALAYSHSMLAPLYELDPTSPAYRQTGYAPHPTGPRGRPIVPMGGYALAIPNNLAKERFAGARIALRSLTSASATKLLFDQWQPREPKGERQSRSRGAGDLAPYRRCR